MFLNTKAASEALGCAIIDAKAADKVLALDNQDFESEVDKDILGAMRALRGDGRPITLVTLNAITGSKYTDYLIDISTSVVSTVFVDEHIKTIKEASKRRRIRAAATELFNAASDTNKPLEELTAEFAHRVDSLAQVETGVVSARDAVMELANGIERKDDNKALTGIPLLDQSLGGLHGGRLYVIGAQSTQ